MRTAKEMTEILYHVDSYMVLNQALKDWAEEIVNTCGYQLSDDGAIQEGWLYDKIMRVKKEI